MRVTNRLLITAGAALALLGCKTRPNPVVLSKKHLIQKCGIANPTDQQIRAHTKGLKIEQRPYARITGFEIEYPACPKNVKIVEVNKDCVKPKPGMTPGMRPVVLAGDPIKDKTVSDYSSEIISARKYLRSRKLRRKNPRLLKKLKAALKKLGAVETDKDYVKAAEDVIEVSEKIKKYLNKRRNGRRNGMKPRNGMRPRPMNGMPVMRPRPMNGMVALPPT